MALSNHNGTWILAHAEYQELLRQARKLEALEATGVDNWDGYENAMEVMHGGEVEC